MRAYVSVGDRARIRIGAETYETRTRRGDIMTKTGNRLSSSTNYIIYVHNTYCKVKKNKKKLLSLSNFLNRNSHQS